MRSFNRNCCLTLTPGRTDVSSNFRCIYHYLYKHRLISVLDDQTAYRPSAFICLVTKSFKFEAVSCPHDIKHGGLKIFRTDTIQCSLTSLETHK